MNKNQHGFSAIIPVLIVAALAVICFAGWRLWDSSQNKQSSNNAANSSQASQQSSMQSTNTTDPNEGYVVIKEWGVRFKPVEGLTGTVYAISTDSTFDGSAVFSTEALTQLGPGCGTGSNSAMPLGRLIRSGVDHRQEFMSAFGESNKQIGDYYYHYATPQASCLGAGGSQLQTDTIQLFKPSIATLEIAK